MIQHLPQLHMRHTLAALPKLSVPAGYGLRTFDAGDVAVWAALLAKTGELGEWNAARATSFFAPAGHMPLAGAFFVTKDGEPVATAQLHLHPDDEYAPMPELGWVAARPAHRGHGLGSVVCLAVMRYAASLGHRQMFLRTDDFRLPAIRTYLKLGFQPWISDPIAPERWRAVFQALNAGRQRFSETST